MNTLFKHLLFITAAIVALNIVACGKNENKGGVISGNVSSDGQTVATNSSISGMTLNMSVTNINKSGNVYGTNNNYNYGYNNSYNNYYGNQYGYNNGYYPYGNQYNNYYGNNTYSTTGVQFTITVNGQTKTVVSAPSVANLAYYGYTTSGQMSQDYIANFQMWYESRCGNQNCDQIYINLIIGNGYETKQIGIRKNMLLNRVTGVLERQGSSSSMLSTEQIVQQIISQAGPA